MGEGVDYGSWSRTPLRLYCIQALRLTPRRLVGASIRGSKSASNRKVTMILRTSAGGLPAATMIAQ